MPSVSLDPLWKGRHDDPFSPGQMHSGPAVDDRFGACTEVLYFLHHSSCQPKAMLKRSVRKERRHFMWGRFPSHFIAARGGGAGHLRRELPLRQCLPRWWPLDCLGAQHSPAAPLTELTRAAGAGACGAGGRGLLSELFAPVLWAVPKKKPSYRKKRVRQQSRTKQYFNTSAIEFCGHCNTWKRRGHLSRKCVKKGGGCKHEEGRWAARRAARLRQAARPPLQ